MDKRRVQLDVDSYCTYPGFRRPTWLGDLLEEVTEVGVVATTLLLVVSITVALAEDARHFRSLKLS